MKKTEAEDKLDAKRNELAGRFCPLIGAQCHGENCMSWNAGRVWQLSAPLSKQDSERWTVSEPYCMSAAVTGYVDE